MRRFLLAIAVLFVASPVLAQTQQQIDWCNSPDVTDEQTIAGCSGIIEAGLADPAGMSVAYSNRGTGYMGNGRIDQAFADFNQAIALDPGNYAPYYPRGEIYLSDGSVDSALADYNTYLALGGPLPGAYKSRADIYYNKGLNDQALADYNAYLAARPDDLEAVFRRGNLHYDAGRYVEALDDYTTYLTAEPAADMVFAYRGDTYAKMGEGSLAKEDYRKALALFPDNKVARDGLARLGSSASPPPDFAPSASVASAQPPVEQPAFKPSVADPPAQPPLTPGGLPGGERQVAAPPPQASGQCITMAPVAGTAHAVWRLHNACGYAVSGYYCYENGAQKRCIDPVPAEFGPVPSGGSTDVVGPGATFGETFYKISFCPHDQRMADRCTLARFN